MIEHTQALSRFENGWYDGETGVAASLQTIQDAITFLSKLDFDWIPTPFISLASDGEIDFWWDLDNLKLGVDFFGDGTYAYYGKTVSNKTIIKKFSGDEIGTNTPLEPDLLKELLWAGYITKVNHYD